ncbi:MAG: NAD(P)H-dependent flavin oxidoreductase [Aquabacterium sp.]
MQTRLSQHLGIEHPLFNAGIGAAAGADLAAAVCNAGAGGVLGTAALPARFVRDEIRRLRTLTAKPFGVNLVLPILRRGQFEACLEERVRFVVLFWGEADAYTRHIEAAHREGVEVHVQVGSVAEARIAAACGADALIVQGFEAGGHVRGHVALTVLLPTVVDTVAPIPVIAAGGIADGRGLVAALALGAQGVAMGTRFLASDEANASAHHKHRVTTAMAEDAVHTTLFDAGWAAPHRVLRNVAMARWEAAGRPVSGQRPGEGESVGAMASAGTHVEVPAYSAYVPERGLDEQQAEQMALYAGQSCALVDAVLPAARIVERVMREAAEAVERLGGLRGA